MYRRNDYYPEENYNNKEQYYDIPQKIQQLQNFIKVRAARLKDYANKNSRLKFDIPNIPEREDDLKTILSDILSGTASDDFDFRENDAKDVEEDDEDLDEIGQSSNKFDNVLRPNEDDGKLVIEASGKPPSNDDNIVDFAYEPGDPRFYKTTARTGKIYFIIIS